MIVSERVKNFLFYGGIAAAFISFMTVVALTQSRLVEREDLCKNACDPFAHDMIGGQCYCRNEEGGFDREPEGDFK